MGFFDDPFGEEPAPAEAPGGAVEGRWTGGGGLAVSLFVGELTAAPAEALAVSTNPKLSLGGGTGRAVLEETGWGLKRAAEDVVAEEARRSGRDELPVGSTHATPGGRPPHRLIVLCVACDSLHHASTDAVRRCTEGTLAHAAEAGCASVALPLFGAGHADLPWEESLSTLAETLRDAATPIREAFVVLLHPDRTAAARAILDRVLSPP